MKTNFILDLFGISILLLIMIKEFIRHLKRKILFLTCALCALFTCTSVQAEVLSQVTYTVRLNPNSVDWSTAYACVWTGSTEPYDAYIYYAAGYSYGAEPVIWGQQAHIDEEGWFSVSFQIEENTPYHVGWMENTNSDYPSSTLTNQTSSVCMEFNNNGELQTTTCKSIIPDETNTYTVHVATAGTFGQVLVQALGTKTWTDVLALTVTGTLNEADMQYLGRMTNLQILDLSGTNITNIGGCKDMSKLSKVTLPTTCIQVNDNAFYGCSGMSAVIIPNSVTSIGSQAFRGCSNLTFVAVPQSVTAMGSSVFYGCSRLQSMLLLGTVCDYFTSGASNVRNLFLAPSVTSIKGLGISPSQVYCYGAVPAACDASTFNSYSGALHVPPQTLAPYFTADYWGNFNSFNGDALWPKNVNITLSDESVTMKISETAQMTALIDSIPQA